MEISGKIIAVLPMQSGTSNSGKEWQKQEFVIETQGDYPKKMYYQLFGEEKIKSNSANVGDEVTVSFDIDAKEWNGRWFNSINAWKVEVSNAANASSAKVDNSKLTDNPQEKDDLPF